MSVVLKLDHASEPPGELAGEDCWAHSGILAWGGRWWRAGGLGPQGLSGPSRPAGIFDGDSLHSG